MILLPWLVKSEYTKSHINVNSGNPAEPSSRLHHGPSVASSYCSTTLAGMRPRALTVMP
jgi:hypothetical protein